MFSQLLYHVFRNNLRKFLLRILESNKSAIQNNNIKYKLYSMLFSNVTDRAEYS